MSNSIHKLSHKDCINAKPKEKPYRLFDGGNLYLEVNPTGGKSWYSKYRYLGREKRRAHGQFPTLGLAEAREKNQAVKRLLLNNIDPALAKRQAKRQAELEAKNTFKAIALEWHENTLERWSDEHGKGVLNNLVKDVFPKIGDLPIKDITTPEIVTMLQAIEKRGAVETARRVKYMCSQVFLYAKVKGWINHNPTEGVNIVLQPVVRKHHASIGIDELPTLLRSVDESTTTEQVKLAIRFMMLTFLRTGELIGARWDEIDFEKRTWIVIAQRMKGKKHQKRAHTVPLSTQAIAILMRFELPPKN